VDNNTGQSGHATVRFSKISDFYLDYHRPLTESTDIIEVILKNQQTADWDVSIVLEYNADYPDKPAVENISIEDTGGIDLGITRFSHDSENRVFARLDEHKDRERVDKRHQNLPLKQYESEN
jgi:hypothetical protein